MTDERMDGLIIDRQAFRYCKDQQPSAHGRTCYPATPRCCQILTLWGHAQWQGSVHPLEFRHAGAEKVFTGATGEWPSVISEKVGTGPPDP
jgi:hypothetical protein